MQVRNMDKLLTLGAERNSKEQPQATKQSITTSIFGDMITPTRCNLAELSP